MKAGIPGAAPRHPAAMALLCAAALSTSPGADGQSVVTVAGGGAGDGGPAVSAGLGYLGGLVVDPSGNVFFADETRRSIRRIDHAAGTITTILTLEEKDAPRFLALGPSGRLFFTSQFRVEEIDLATGRRTLVAGNGDFVFRNRVVQEGRPAGQVPLGRVSGLAVGPGGEVYFGDRDHSQVFRVHPVTGLLERVCTLDSALVAGGNPEASSVHDVAVDSLGRVHFSDQRHHRIFRVDSGRAVAVAGNGTPRPFAPRPGAPPGREDDVASATSSPLNRPGPLAFRAVDELVFGEEQGTVLRLSRSGSITTLLSATISSNRISGVAFDQEGTLYVASHPAYGIGQVLLIPRASGEPQVIAGSGVPHCCGDGALAPQAELAEPEGITVAPDGDLVVADRANHRIRRVSARTGRIATIAGGGEFALPGSRHVVFHHVRAAPPPGRIQGLLFEVLEPRFVASDAAGHVYFAQRSGPVYRIDAGDGTISALGVDRKSPRGPKFPDGFNEIGGVAVDASGTVFVAAENRIWRISPAGGVGILAGTGHEGFAGDGEFAILADLARPAWPVVDRQGRVTFVDTGNSRIRRVDRSGKITTVAGNGLGFPSGEGLAIREAIGPARGLAIDLRGDLVYTTGDNRIWRLTQADGKLHLVVGREPSSGRPSPDGPLSGISSLGHPLALACDGRGALFFSEPELSRVRAVRP